MGHRPTCCLHCNLTALPVDNFAAMIAAAAYPTFDVLTLAGGGGRVDR